MAVFCQNERSGKWDGSRKNSRSCFFLSVVGNRDVWCVACLFAKLGFFFVFHLRRRLWRHCYVNGSDEVDPLVVEQALLKCLKALWSAEFSVVWRLGDTNKWALFVKAKALSCVEEWNSARNNWLLSFPCFKRVNFSYAGSFWNICVFVTVFVYKQ